MKPMIYTSLALSLLLILGCATTFRPWKLSEVQEGMTRDQVVQILGEPDSDETTDGTDLLYYSYREDYNPPLSADDSNTPGADHKFEDQQFRRSAKQYKFVVKLVDGKVQHYKELTN
jgi:outer membrane protein assembly factor BamE (lipoprotein component of BamABCDE complex)